MKKTAIRQYYVIVVLFSIYTRCFGELMPSLDLKPSGYIFFRNETRTKTSSNTFSLYVKLHDEIQEKQHIISIRSESRSEQFIKVSLIQMQLSLLINLRHPAVSRWFLVGDKFQKDQPYYIKIAQNRTDLKITINNVTVSKQLESVEEFVYPVKIAIGNIQTTRGMNGSLAGLSYNGVSILNSYIRRDQDFQNVGVEMGGEVSVKEREWTTVEELNKKYCPHNVHFPKSEVGTEIRLSCQQNIARAVCGESQIWLVEKCEVEEDISSIPRVRNGKKDKETISTKDLIIYIGAAAAAICVVTVIIIAVVVRRNNRNRVHRYKMAAHCEQEPVIPRLHGISTLPIKIDSLTTKHNLRNSLEMSCSTLENAANSDILDNRIPVFTGTTNPLPRDDELYPMYMDSDSNIDRMRDEDIISTILGERTERQVHHQGLIPSSLLNSNSGLNSDVSTSWQDV